MASGEACPAVFAQARRKTASLIGICAFATTLTAMDRGLVKVPLAFLLKDRLQVSALAMSLFTMVAVSPLWFKPITGMISDSFPIKAATIRFPNHILRGPGSCESNLKPNATNWNLWPWGSGC
jgi:hypothetical protein